jgi:hypothetical protein
MFMLSHHHAGTQHYTSPLLHQQWPSQSRCLARAPRRCRALTAAVVAAASSDADEQRSLFIFGLGYTSLGLVAAARARGTWCVWFAGVHACACAAVRYAAWSPLLKFAALTHTHARTHHHKKAAHHVDQPPPRAPADARGRRPRDRSLRPRGGRRFRVSGMCRGGK